MKPPYISRREFTPPGVPKVPEKVLEAGSTLLEELDAPSSVAEFDHVQAKLESDTKDTANKMEGGCLREFTRFLEKEVRVASPHSHSHEATRPFPSCRTTLAHALLSQDPKNKWADLQRALLAEGQSVWCCKNCIGIINKDKDATYEEIRVKVEAAAKPLPEITGESADPLEKAGAAVKAAEQAEQAEQAAVARAEAAVARAEAAEAATTAAKPTVELPGVEIGDEVEVPAAPLLDTPASPPQDTNELRPKWFSEVATGISEIKAELAKTQRASVICTCGIQ